MFFFFDEDENKKEVPSFEKTLKPILTALQENGGQATIAELDEKAILKMNLPDDILQIMHNGSDRQSEISYRMAWGRTYLKKYGLITNVSRGVWAFTDKFNGDIENIDVQEIVRKVRNANIEARESQMSLTGFESSLAFENMVGALLREAAKREGKEAYYAYSDSMDSGYDIILPNGLEGEEEPINCIIEYVRISGKNITDFYNKIHQRLENCLGNDKVLLVTNVYVPDDIRKRFGENVIVWDKEDLLERIEPDASYAQYLINPQQALIEEVVATDNSNEEKFIEREIYIKQAKRAFRNQDMVLFLGAGVSIDGGIPLWKTLIKTLHVYMLNRLTKDKDLSFEQQEMIKELAADNEMESPLMQMRYIKAAFANEEYYKFVHSALYGQPVNIDTKLLDSIAKISTPQRGYCGIRSIVTYNFDDLLERKFSQKDIRYNTIFDEGGRQLIDKLNVYHVHGFLPSDISNISNEPNLVFSEEDYHRVYRDSFSWSNLAQLSALRENTCIFIGCSLTDPNLRRLLDAAARRDENPRHYAFLRKNKISDKRNGEMVNKDILELYQKIDDNIQTAYYKKLGLNIIWIDEFDEIPDILNSFLE